MKSHHFLITVAVLLSVLVQPIRAAEPLGIDESPVISGTQVVSDTSQVFVEIIASALNVRGGPGTGYSPIGLVREGDEPEIIGVHPDTRWLKVKLEDGSEGWISSSEKFVKQVDLTNVLEITEVPELPEQLVSEPVEPPQPVEEQQQETVLSPEEIIAIQRGERGVDAYVDLLMPKFNVKDLTSQHLATNTFDPYTGLTDAEIDFIVGAIGKYHHVITPEERQEGLLPQMICASRSSSSTGSCYAICFSTGITGREPGKFSDEERRWLVLTRYFGHELGHCILERDGNDQNERYPSERGIAIAERLLPYGFPPSWIDHSKRYGGID